MRWPCWVLGPLLTLTLTGFEDPMQAPQELKDFARRVTLTQVSTPARLNALLDALMRPESEGGLGLSYDNAYTRTVEEAWRDRKANCLSMTALFVAACDSIGVRAEFAEALNTNRWRRVGTVIRFERHMVALVPQPPMNDLVADFLPQLRRRLGLYRVEPLSASRVRALFYSNRAVEELEKSQPDQALALVLNALKVDDRESVGWNILGVIYKYQGKPEEAERAFLSALKRDPKDTSAIGNLESLMREGGRFKDAQHYRDMGQEMRKKDPYYQAFLSEEALDEGNFEESSKLLKRAIKLLPHEPEFYLLQARLNLALSKPEAAAKSLEEATRRAMPSERQRYEHKLDALKEMDRQKGDSEPKGEDE